MSDFILVNTADHSIEGEALGYDPRDPEHLPKEGLAWYEWLRVTDDQTTPGSGSVTLAPVRVFDDVGLTVTDTTVIRDETTQEEDDRKFSEVDNEMKGVAALSFNDAHNAIKALLDAVYASARVITPGLTKATFESQLLAFAAGANGYTTAETKALLESFKASAAGVSLQATKNYLKAFKDV